MNHGYKINFCSTVNGIQGATLPKIILDLTKQKTGHYVLPICYVEFSRVKNATTDMRRLPTPSFQRNWGHLTNLTYNKNYIIWNNFYDINGNFNVNLIPTSFNPRANDNIEPLAQRPRRLPSNIEENINVINMNQNINIHSNINEIIQPSININIQENIDYEDQDDNI